MNKIELIASIAEKTGMKKRDIDVVLNGFIDVVKETLKKGDKVALIGFGTWGTRERKARNGVNPKTKAKITIPAKVTPYFKVGKELKEAVLKK
jgi:DNA-binding protein HU-beta|uniref:HU family DNA-binding protein n=1 Tax=candidate division CPR3 bacterium TaxID=2268181 RepID=A0A7C5URQ1_UNCC3